VPPVQLTALLILGVAGMPAMVEHVSSRSYPQLERRRGGSFAGGLWNSAAALAGMIALFAVSVPLWFFPPLWPLIPVAVMGWNQRILLMRLPSTARHEMSMVFCRRLACNTLSAPCWPDRLRAVVGSLPDRVRPDFHSLLLGNWRCAAAD
jgi:hypothetical protein